MESVLVLMLAQGLLGAGDTLYYHEYRHRLPARAASARTELRLHAARDGIYAVLFLTLPWMSWSGLAAVGLWALLATEVVITLADFNVEVASRQALGGLPAGERTAHAVMAIVYGAFLARLLPVTVGWLDGPSGLILNGGTPSPLALALSAMGAGVLASGLRDLGASVGLPGCAWPWGPAALNGGEHGTA